MAFPKLFLHILLISPFAICFLGLWPAAILAKTKPHELFRGCAVKMKQRSGTETLIGYVKEDRLTMSNNSSATHHRALFFGLGGRVYLGNGKLASLCEEDKVFNKSNAKVEVKYAKMTGCEGTNKLVYQTIDGKENGAMGRLALYEDKKLRRNKCRANSTTKVGESYEIFNCTKEMCGNDKLLFVRKKQMPHNEFVVEEVIIADRPANGAIGEKSSPNECLKNICMAKPSEVEEVVRTIEVKAEKVKKVNKNGGHASNANKLFRECAITRKGRGGGKMESLIAHARVDKQVLFFSMAEQLYIGESELARECAEDKYFNATDIAMKSAKIVLPAKTSMLMMEANYGGKSEKGHLEVKPNSNRNKIGSRCRAGVFEVYLCPEAICHGHDKLLLVKKKAMVVGKRRVEAMIYRGKLLVEEVVVANVSSATVQFVRRKCQTVGVPIVEEVVRTKKHAKDKLVEKREGRMGRKKWTKE